MNQVLSAPSPSSTPDLAAWQVAVAPSTLGLVLVAITSEGVRAILVGDDADALRADLAARFPAATLVPIPAHDPTVRAVIAHIDHPSEPLTAPLHIRGTPFQERVWAALRQIPAGTTITYAQLAQAIGAPTATRAVATACAANTHAVAIPCHRVVRSDGSLSGYRWGVERKRVLLGREGATR